MKRIIDTQTEKEVNDWLTEKKRRIDKEVVKFTNNVHGSLREIEEIAMKRKIYLEDKALREGKNK